MSETIDVDLDALAPQAKRVKLAGKLWRLPGDLPMSLFLRMQRYEQRVKPEDEGGAGEDEGALLEEIADELLKLFQHNHPKLTVLPGMAPGDVPQLGLSVLLKAIGAIYSAGEPGETQPATPAKRKRTTTKTSSARSRAARATSR